MYITIRAGYTMTIKEIRQHKNSTIRQQIFTYLIHVRKEISSINTRFFTVSTNKAIYFGAAMLLNLQELKKLADRVDSDLYLLPSSVHEILAIRTDQHEDVSFLTNAVNAINYYEVKPEDYLSDNVYYFDREKCEVTIAVPA